jgi:large conductance mechanosensitive channel
MWKEFKEFAIKGNVIDLAVAVIIGGAFGKIVSSLVNDVVMPAVGLLLGGISFADLQYVVKPEVLDAAGNVIQPGAAIKYGAFIQAIVDFFIIAFVIFMFVKIINKLKRPKKVEEPVVEEPKPSDEVVLLQEIRDLLKDGKAN